MPAVHLPEEGRPVFVRFRSLRLEGHCVQRPAEQQAG